MSLLDELQSLDLTDVINARADITAAVTKPELQAILGGGTVEVALGQFGEALSTVQSILGQDPAALLRPLAEGLGDLIGSLDLSNVPLAEYLSAVRDGAAMVAKALEGIDDPSQLGKGLGLSLGDALTQAQNLAEGYSLVGADELGQFTQLVQRVEKGVPADPAALTDLALEVLLPFPKEPLQQVRRVISDLLEGALSVELPISRNQGVVAALEAVRSTAESGDVAQLNAALSDLATVRASTLSSIGNDLLRIFQDVDGLRIQSVLEEIVEVANTLPVGEQGVLEYLRDFETVILAARANVENLDLGPLLDILPELLDQLETLLRSIMVDPIDAAVDQLEEHLRELFAQLPIRTLRAGISGEIHSAAVAIGDADLGRYGREAKQMLAVLASLADAPDLAETIASQLEGAKTEIVTALTTIDTALGAIAAAVEDLAGSAREILERTAALLEDFAALIQDIKDGFDLSSIDDAAQQVIGALRELRQTAEEMLSGLALPEPLRVLVEQLITQIEQIKPDELFTEELEKVDELFKFSDEIEETVTAALAEAANVVSNLIPDELIQAIQAEIQDALDTIAGFNPAKLLTDVTAQINEVADLIEGFTIPQEVMAEIRAPYLAVVEVLDSAQPSRILESVFEAYDDLLGNLAVPSPETGTRQVMEQINSANEQMAQSLMNPVTQLLPGASPVTEPSQAEIDITVPDDVRLGDIARMFGYLPNKLREFLAELDEGQAGAVLRTIDALCGRLASDLRAVETAFWAIDDRLTESLDQMLSPLAGLQLDAQIAIQANFAINDADIDVDAALDLLAEVSPAVMLHELEHATSIARNGVRLAATGVAEDAGVAMERIAANLERCQLANLGEDLEGFLIALDPAPIAQALDEFGEAVIAQAPDMIAEHREVLLAAAGRLRDILRSVSPGTQLQKFLRLLDIVREEIDLLNPRRLAAELDEVYAALVEVVSAYDPASFATELEGLLAPIAGTLKALDPAALLGDLTPFTELVEKAGQLNPALVLQEVGGGLQEVGNRLVQLNPAQLLELIDTLRTEIMGAFQKVLEAIQQEIVGLLESLNYYTAQARVAASMEV